MRRNYRREIGEDIEFGNEGVARVEVGVVAARPKESFFVLFDFNATDIYAFTFQ